MFVKLKAALVLAALACLAPSGQVQAAAPPVTGSPQAKHLAFVFPVIIDLDSRLPPPTVLYLTPGQTVTFVHGQNTRVGINPPYGLVMGGRIGVNTYQYRCINRGSGMFLVSVSGGPGRQGSILITVFVR